MGIGFWEAAFLLVAIGLIFGSGRIPTVMRDLGKGIRKIRDGFAATKETPGDAIPGRAAPPLIEGTGVRISVSDPVPPPPGQA